ncbi:BadM/Rrf2 family transcriptional regulator [Breznakibacter xylanolyticus]|uniref:BadM/Rrf2 family transcriptional regulator n=1 Tax=Breznakibacter xylanolyticus TaxID=990 RepID=A0A2W7NLS5_9BACT|nr:Rrf2 family transcriptional regulator [Breznakibacter xylanolyticus]MBN2744369.1 Rrf2 family transcriptional regulator [Marinilabiliaceae bacterium]PZX12242.1 BadM/Rrf2 family transcriptional regulator [Breznakibacter xylanolyticus]
MSNILSLSEAATIGLHSMVLIAQSTEKLNAGQIADRIGSSKHHVAKIMQRLAKENFITSNRGPLGGFILKKKPEEISLLDVFEAIEGKISEHECPGNKEECPFGNCILGSVSHRLTQDFLHYLKSQTLSKYI